MSVFGCEGTLAMAIHGPLAQLRQLPQAVEDWQATAPYQETDVLAEVVAETAEIMLEEIQQELELWSTMPAAASATLSWQTDGLILADLDCLQQMAHTLPSLAMAAIAEFHFSITDATSYRSFYSPVGAAVICPEVPLGERSADDLLAFCEGEEPEPKLLLSYQDQAGQTHQIDFCQCFAIPRWELEGDAVQSPLDMARQYLAEQTEHIGAKGWRQPQIIPVWQFPAEADWLPFPPDLF